MRLSAYYRRRRVDDDAGEGAPDHFVRFCFAKADAAPEAAAARLARRFREAQGRQRHA